MALFAGTSTTVAAEGRGFLSHTPTHIFQAGPRARISVPLPTLQTGYCCPVSVFTGCISVLRFSAFINLPLWVEGFVVWIVSECAKSYLSQSSPPHRGNNGQNPSGSQSTSSLWESRTAPVSWLWLPYKQTEKKREIKTKLETVFVYLRLTNTHCIYL